MLLHPSFTQKTSEGPQLHLHAQHVHGGQDTATGSWALLQQNQP